VRGAADVVLRDSAAYESAVGSGTLAVLYVSDTFVDSVDAAFGASKVGEDSLVFLPVRSFALDNGGRGAEITRHVLATRGQRRELEGWLPYFTSYFSSPVVQARSLYYWGLRPMSAAGGRYELYAMRYTFGANRLDSLRLGRVELYTDNRFHLPPPALTDSGVVFAGDSGTYLVDRDFRTVERHPHASRPAVQRDAAAHARGSAHPLRRHLI
jgi:hypothetical protein